MMLFYFISSFSSPWFFFSPYRESVIDFSKPFMNLGISILFKVRNIFYRYICIQRREVILIKCFFFPSLPISKPLHISIMIFFFSFSSYIHIFTNLHTITNVNEMYKNIILNYIDSWDARNKIIQLFEPIGNEHLVSRFLRLLSGKFVKNFNCLFFERKWNLVLIAVGFFLAVCRLKFHSLNDNQNWFQSFNLNV